MSNNIAVSFSSPFGYDLKYYTAKRWFLFWLINEYWPNGIPVDKVVPFVTKKSLELMKLGFVLRIPPEPFPGEEIDLFIKDEQMETFEKPNPGMVFRSTEKGNNEFSELRVELEFEKRLDLGPWDEVRKRLSDDIE